MNDKRTAEEQIAINAKTLDISIEEATALYYEDIEVDRMKDKEVDNDITKEQKQTIKAYKNVGRGKEVERVDAYGKKVKKERPPDIIKRELIQNIADFIATNEDIENVNITNIQKYIQFELKGELYEINLIRKRTPKK